MIDNHLNDKFKDLLIPFLKNLNDKDKYDLYHQRGNDDLIISRFYSLNNISFSEYLYLQGRIKEDMHKTIELLINYIFTVIYVIDINEISQKIISPLRTTRTTRRNRKSKISFIEPKTEVNIIFEED